LSAFLDSNIVLYAYLDDPRRQRAQELLAGGPVLSAQVLNEFVNVMRRKFHASWVDVDAAVSLIVAAASEVVPITPDLTIAALRYARRYQLNFYDALIVAAARVMECSTLYSEDLHDGLVVDGVRVVNPFR
jgi:predicted nucleic acid-binding protein